MWLIIQERSPFLKNFKKQIKRKEKFFDELTSWDILLVSSASITNILAAS